MKVVMIGQKGFPAIWGGVEQHVDRLTRGLGKHGIDVVVYVRPHYTNRNQVEQWNTQENQRLYIVSIPTIPTKHLDTIIYTFFSLVHALVVVKPEVYHIHSVGPSLLAWIPRLFNPSARVVVTFHSPDRLQQKWNWFARLMLLCGEWTAVHFAHETITVSQELQTYTHNRYGKEITFIPNGVSTLTHQKPSMITAAFDLQGNDYFLVVSRLVQHKDIHNVIDAYQRIATDKKLVIVGDSVYTDGYLNELRRRSADNTQIIFAGFQHGRMLEELFSNTSAFIHASTSEGMSLALLEAASYGVPIIASDISSSREVVLNAAYLFTAGDSEALAQQLIYVESHPTEAAEQAKEARQFVLAHYHWDEIVNSTAAVYNTSYDDQKEPLIAPRQAR